ncbi:MAG: hypothetical protein IJX02_07820 [Clostridia bacterium]|nr:hypothetical protein [Clostridia bacterium]
MKKEIILRTVGIILAVCGLVLNIVGTVDFFENIGTKNSPELFWCCFVGIPMLAIGLMAVMLSFKKAIIARGIKKQQEIMNSVLEEQNKDI